MKNNRLKNILKSIISKSYILCDLCPNDAINIIVKPDGTGDFLSPKMANDSIKDASFKKIYNVIIYPGVYKEINWERKQYVNLIGIDRDTCILEGSLPICSSDKTIEKSSTLDSNLPGIVKNLTITCKNMRYAIHDDTRNRYLNVKKMYENIKCIHYGNEDVINWRKQNNLDFSNVWRSCCGFGHGISSGAYEKFINCNFEGLAQGMTIHNNADFKNSGEIYMKNCILKSLSNSYDLSLGSLGSGTIDMLILENCDIGKIQEFNKPWLSHKNIKNKEWEIITQ